MCGRFNFTDDELEDIKQIILEVSHKVGGSHVKTGDVFPSETAAVLAMEPAGIDVLPMRWGFPKWDGNGVVFNARAETALERKMFRAPLLIPTR